MSQANQKETAYYYQKWMGDNANGRWNVIQVIGEKAHYYVVKSLEKAQEEGKRLGVTIGWMEEEHFTDGEDTVSVETWEKKEGVLIDF